MAPQLATPAHTLAAPYAVVLAESGPQNEPKAYLPLASPPLRQLLARPPPLGQLQGSAWP